MGLQGLRFVAACVVTLLAARLSAAQEPRRTSDFAALGTAKVLCSACFLAGRDVDEALLNSAGIFLEPEDHRLLISRGGSPDASIEVDTASRTVAVTLRGFTGRARCFGDQGCVVLPPGFDRVFFEPVPVTSSLPDPATVPWPMGERLSPTPPRTPDPARVRRAVELAFADGALTTAVVAVHRGEILAERYGEGAGRDTRLEGWSMGKSVTATLVGVLVEEGRLGLHDPAPVALWREDPDDPRAGITIAELLRMSSGLRFSGSGQPAWELGRAVSDHEYIYLAGIDAFHFAITRPLEFPPNTVGRYRNCDPLVLGHVIRRTVEEAGESYLAWPQKALFDRIGIRSMVLEPDPYGNFLLCGYDHATARDWARLGLLYLQDGVWQGERILPPGFVAFVATPAPAWEAPRYGGSFWVNGEGRWDAPESTYYMAGAGGQYVIVVPTHDLVLVRLGRFRGQDVGADALNAALAELLDTIESP